MKHLIKFPGRSAIALGTLIFTAINIVRAIRTGEVTEEMLSAFFLALFTVIGLYLNMPTSIEGEAALEKIKTQKETRGLGQEYVPHPDEPEDAIDIEDWEGDGDDDE